MNNKFRNTLNKYGFVTIPTIAGINTLNKNK